MRIIGGIYKNRSIRGAKDIRPTTAIVRESVFNMCQGIIDGALFLDLFSGSGAVGIEAVSRGASFVYFLEKKRGCREVILKNIESLGIGDKTDVIGGDLFSSLREVCKKVDIVYIDPPYNFFEDSKFLEKLFCRMRELDILNENAWIFVESSKEEKVLVSNFEFILSKRYGQTFISRYIYCL